MQLKKNDCLKTPYYIYKALGQIDLDPCAGIDTNIGRTNYAIERGEDGLLLDWEGFVYCNPPFSQKELWAEKMINHNDGILLLPERGSAPWFGPIAIKTCKVFIMGKKINFDGGSSSNNIGSYMFLFGDSAVGRVMSSNLPGTLVNVEQFIPR